MSEQSPSHLQRAAAIAALSATALGGFAASAEHLGTDQPPRPQSGHELVLPAAPQDPIEQAHRPPAKPAHAAHVLPTSTKSSHVEQTHSRTPTIETRRKHHKTIKTPRPIKVPETPATPISELKPLGTDKLAISPEVAAVMASETVYLPESRCTGFLVRDSSGKAIGYTSAEHCGLMASSSPTRDYHYSNRIKGSDGNYYLVEQDAYVETGDSMKSLQPAGTVDAMILPAIDDKSMDTAIGVFKGSTPDEVLAAYEASRMPESDVANLAPGQILYSSGYPVAEPKNEGSLQREQFPQFYLGRMEQYFDTGQSIANMIVTAVPVMADGAICSPGVSGQQLFDTSTGKVQELGTQTGYIDLTGTLRGDKSYAETMRKQYEQWSGYDLNGIGALCFYAPTLPSLDGNGSVVKVVSTPAEIPGYQGEITPYDDILKARDAFSDPTSSHTILNGSVYVSGNKGPAFWLDKPALYFDNQTGAAILEAANSYDSQHLSLYYYDNIGDIQLFAHTGDTVPTVLQSQGMPNYQESHANSNGSFIDKAGLEYGIELENGTPAYDGSTVFTLIMGKGDVPYVSVPEASPAEQKFRTDFFDSSMVRHKINGLVEIMTPQGPYWVNDPAYEYDAESNSLMFGVGSLKGGADGLTVLTLPANDIGPRLAVFSHDGQTVPDALGLINGDVTLDIADAGFKDANGALFAQFVGMPPATLGTVYTAIVQDGSLVLNVSFGK